MPLRRKPLFIKSLTHKSLNIDPLYAAQQIVRFPFKEKENVILSRAVHFLQPIVDSESPCGATVALSSNSFYLTEGREGEKRVRVREEEKNLEAFQMQRVASIESSN